MDPPANPQDIEAHQPRKQMTEAERLILIIEYLLLKVDLGRKLGQGKLAALEQRYGRTGSHIRKLFNDYMEQREQGRLFPTLTTLTDIPRGPESALDENMAMCLCEFNSTEGYMLSMRDFREKFNLRNGTTFGVATLQKYSKLINVRWGKSYIKPLLKSANKLLRINWILNELEPVGNGDYRFKNMDNVLHADEKWFYSSTLQHRHRIFPGEERHPDYQVQHKSHITKMMFLCVVGRPQHVEGYPPFDGKIGMWPVADRTAAQRNSVNRPAGTPVWSPNSLTAAEYLDLYTKSCCMVELISIHFHILR